jgi:hypothetical protein
LGNYAFRLHAPAISTLGRVHRSTNTFPVLLRERYELLWRSLEIVDQERLHHSKHLLERLVGETPDADKSLHNWTKLFHNTHHTQGNRGLLLRGEEIAIAG